MKYTPEEFRRKLFGMNDSISLISYPIALVNDLGWVRTQWFSLFSYIEFFESLYVLYLQLSLLIICVFEFYPIHILPTLYVLGLPHIYMTPTL